MRDLLVLVGSHCGEGCLREEEGCLETVWWVGGDVEHWLVLLHRVEAALKGLAFCTFN